VGGAKVLSARGGGGWLAVAAATCATVALFGALQVPSAALVAGLAVGIGFALTGASPGVLPKWGMTAAQATLGVVIGALVQSSTVSALSAVWLPVLAVSVATLALSVLGGLLLGLHREVDPLTGSLALTAGGASGLTAISRDLGADERLVAVVQYLRVVVVIALMPVVTALVFRPSPAIGGPGPSDAAAPWYVDLAFLGACCAAGLPVGRLLRLPAGALLGPLLVAATLTLTGVSMHAAVPGMLAVAAYAVIGLQAGLRFTRDSVRTIAGVLPLAAGLIAVVLVACAGLGVLLARLADVSPLVGYLATTPGGLYAVLATAQDSDADVTFILAVQLVRVLLMLLLAPVLARTLPRLLRRRPVAARRDGPLPAVRDTD